MADPERLQNYPERAARVQSESRLITPTNWQGILLQHPKTSFCRRLCISWDRVLVAHDLDKLTIKTVDVIPCYFGQRMSTLQTKTTRDDGLWVFHAHYSGVIRVPVFQGKDLSVRAHYQNFTISHLCHILRDLAAPIRDQRRL